MLQRLVHLLPPGVRAFLRRIPILVRIYRWLRRGKLTGERYVFAALALLTLVIGFSAPGLHAWAPLSALRLTVLGGGLLLDVRRLVALLGVVAVMVVHNDWKDPRGVGPGMIATLGVTAVLALTLARTRQRLGVQGLRGDSMLLDLRDRLRRQGALPE